jgi:hypothetical protein
LGLITAFFGDARLRKVFFGLAFFGLAFLGEWRRTVAEAGAGLLVVADSPWRESTCVRVRQSGKRKRR